MKQLEINPEFKALKSANKDDYLGLMKDMTQIYISTYQKMFLK